MAVIVVANPKGGVGKSTVATNLAGYLAHRGHAVALGDVDKQESSRLWLSLRPAEVRRILPWDVDRDEKPRLPAAATHGVLDTPAGLSGKRLEAVMKAADRVLVPLQPSVFDIYATRAFIDELLAHRKHARVPVAVIANRVRDHTLAAEHLQSFLQTLPVPVLGILRDTQNYVHLAAHGLSLWDVAPGRVTRDLSQWLPILQWLQSDSP